MRNQTRLYSLSLRDGRTYALTAIFMLGNIVLPQICHLAPHGGQMFLPIFFFTLVGAYKYGFTVGLATAVLSPIANSMLFSMPSAQMLPPMLIQSVVLAAASAACSYSGSGSNEGKNPNFLTRSGCDMASKGMGDVAASHHTSK